MPVPISEAIKEYVQRLSGDAWQEYRGWEPGNKHVIATISLLIELGLSPDDVTPEIIRAAVIATRMRL